MSTRDHDDDDTTDASSKTSVTFGSIGTAAEDERQIVRRTLTVEINGSLVRLQNHGKRMEWTLPEGIASKVFAPLKSELTGNPEDDKLADIKNVILHNVTMESVNSTFPISLGVEISGVEGRSFTRTGNQYATIVPPRTTVNTAVPLTAHGEQLTNSDYLAKYPGMTIDNIRTKGVVQVADENVIFVDRTHPVIEMLEANSDVLQVGLDASDLIDNRWFKVASDVFNDCSELLAERLLAKLPVENLEAFKVVIERAGNVDWDTAHGIGDSVTATSDRALEHMMQKENSLCMQISVEYSFM
jgi:hypothetical protein